MDRDEFESKVLELWAKSRIPLTEENLQYFAGVSRKKLTSWIDELLESGVLDIKIDASAELTYTVANRTRSADGPRTPEAYERKRALIEEAKRRILAKRAGVSVSDTPTNDDVTPKKRLRAAPEADEREEETEDEEDGPSIAGMVGKAAILAGTTALVTLDKPLSVLDKPRGKGEKSLLGSAALSLLGPVGWLYAGSFREAVPATLAFAAGYYILPTFLLAPFVLVGALASSAVGLGYAWQYNRKKQRTPLFLKGKSDKKKKKND